MKVTFFFGFLLCLIFLFFFFFFFVDEKTTSQCCFILFVVPPQTFFFLIFFFPGLNDVLCRNKSNVGRGSPSVCEREDDLTFFYWTLNALLMSLILLGSILATSFANSICNFVVSSLQSLSP